ncbi:MAG: PorT family protein [Paludibacter sp.]|nr:PorT family protein [Paludibacter sp.]
MKKILIVAVLLLSFSFAKAQLNFGIKAGYNSSLSLSNASSLTNGGYDLKSVQAEIWNNFHAGFFARVGFGNMIYFQPELLYSIQKRNYQVSFEDAVAGNITLDKFANISTVDVPLLVGVKLLDLKVANVRAFAGPKLRFNNGSSLEFDKVSGGNFNMSTIKKDIKDAQLGLEIGAGIDVLMLALDVRYNLIGDMYTTKIGDVNLQNLPSNTFVISLGWKIF